MMLNQFQAEYQSKRMTAEEALSHIKTGDVIGTSQCGVDPKTLLGKLHTITPRVTDLTMMCGMCVNEYPFMNDPAYKEHFTLDGIFFMWGQPGGPQAGAAQCIPGQPPQRRRALGGDPPAQRVHRTGHPHG